MHDMMTALAAWFGGVFCAGIVIFIYLKWWASAFCLSGLTAILAALTLYMLA